MPFVPEPHIFKDEEIRARADGRFGVVDCFQWPQDHCEEYQYAACIPRQEFEYVDPNMRWAWYTPTSEDFVPLHNSPAVGTLKAEKADGLHCMWRSGNAQCAFLDIWVFMEFVEVLQPRINFPDLLPHAVNETWMGVFTCKVAVCDQLFRAGVPVWLVCTKTQIRPDMNVGMPVLLTYPDHIVKAMYHEGSRGSITSKQPGPSSINRAGTASRSQDAKLPSQRRVNKSQQKCNVSFMCPSEAPSSRNSKGGRDKWQDPDFPQIPSIRPF
ncbi:hypothetical protein BU15DRAFT_66413 [Melanogaster broomeanus]|nr:hypothetical protein BU15DRAFT_66413 [Melanogaster broomeanus]